MTQEPRHQSRHSFPQSPFPSPPCHTKSPAQNCIAAWERILGSLRPVGLYCLLDRTAGHICMVAAAWKAKVGSAEKHTRQRCTARAWLRSEENTQSRLLASRIESSLTNLAMMLPRSRTAGSTHGEWIWGIVPDGKYTLRRGYKLHVQQK